MLVEKHGSFTGLAQAYSKYRPDYSTEVLDKILTILGKPISNLRFVDVGAGTGIWTRMLEKMHPLSILAIEPNDDMRREGIEDSVGTAIQWYKGNAEATGLPINCCDCVSMASSFHWPDFAKAVKEFNRILTSKGFFVALWNPRDMNANPMLKEIEDYMYKLKPDLKRVSSGASLFVESLTERLTTSGVFSSVQYVEGKQIRKVTIDQYIGAWRSTNDVPYQLGEEKFEKFLSFLKKKLANEEILEVAYLTRAWVSQKID